MRLVGLLAFLLLSLSTQAAAGQASEPFEILRSLEAVQDDLAATAESRKELEARLKVEFVDAIRAHGSDLWRSSRNRLALVAFILRGGAIEPGVILSAEALASQFERTVLRGALANAARNDAEALKSFGSIDPRQAPPEVGGLLALTMARLVARDRQKSLRYLDMARLLAPGSLIEEAALRQQVFIASSPLELDLFASLSRRYLGRFAATTFYGNFIQRFRPSFVSGWIQSNRERRAILLSALMSMRASDRTDLLLAAASEALKSGAHDACLDAAQRVREAGAESYLVAQALLFEAASEIYSNRNFWAVETLAKLEPAMLTSEQRRIRDVVASVAEWMRSPAADGGLHEATATSDAYQSVRARIDSAELLLRGGR